MAQVTTDKETNRASRKDYRGRKLTDEEYTRWLKVWSDIEESVEYMKKHSKK